MTFYTYLYQQQMKGKPWSEARRAAQNKKEQL
jgi:hypothetical protein